MTTLREILRRTPIKLIVESHKRLYPEYNFKAQQQAYKTIFNSKKQKSDPDEMIQIEYIREDNGENWWVTNTNKLSFSFRPWKQIGNLQIDPKILATMTDQDIIAHCLWEMTFYGSEAKAKKIKKSLFKKAHKV